MNDNPRIVERNLAEMKSRARLRALIGGTWYVNKRNDGTYYISSSPATRPDETTVTMYRKH